MATPPSSLPSPTPSSSSSHHPTHQPFASFAQQSASAPARAPSAASHLSNTSGRHPNGGDQPLSPRLYHTDNSSTSAQPTPQPLLHYPHPAANAHPQAYLPPMTSSPPPQAPTYIPPPQYATAPDPIHMHLPPGVPGMMPPPGAGSWQGGWPRYAPQPSGGFRLPNGHGVMPGEGYNGGGRRPDSREGSRRRRDEEGEGRDDEVISTIFVVGFPDDMVEREFQNMFTFAPGFEAATLKFPSSSASASGHSRRDMPTAALIAELTQLAAQQGIEGEQGQAQLEEALAALSMGGTTATSSSTNTPSAAMSLTPSAPSGPFLPSSGVPLPTRRQTIGFARFKTRQDAIAAKEQLQGRKIDGMSGASLKAEMAKKNLHTKRGGGGGGGPGTGGSAAGEELMGLLLRSGRLAGLMNPGNGGMGGGSAGGPGGQSARDAWEAYAASGGAAPGQTGMPGQQLVTPPYPNSVSESTGHGDRPDEMPPPPIPNNAFPKLSSSFPGHNNINNNVNAYPSPPSSYPSNQQSNNSYPPHHLTGSAHSNASTSPPLSVTSPNVRAAQPPTDSKALLALAEEADELEGWSVMGVSQGLDGYQPPQSSQSQPQHRLSQSQQPGFAQQQQQRPRQGSNAAYGAGAPGGGPGYVGSPPGEIEGLGGAGAAGGRLVGTGNPADQNPPINTLYVGNLPAISPPTHPPNFLEESLRGLFSRCPGFKRMSFRQKINGPMCFVEFEEVGFAAQAIREMYGHSLGGLVKGGIRLSYSKNSLGQRGSSHPQSLNSNMFGGIAHTVALAGMSSPASANPSSGANPQAAGGSSPYGLQLQPGPAPINIAGSRNGTANAAHGGGQSQEGTSLSPTAMPFTALTATSPRSRYFGGATSPTLNASSSSPIGLSTSNTSNTNSNNLGFNTFPSATATTTATSSSASNGGGQFSPVSSPIRTPGSFAWVSSSGGGGGTGAAGGAGSGAGMGYGFEAFSPGGSMGGMGMGSFSGAASAWNSSGGGAGSGH